MELNTVKWWITMSGICLSGTLIGIAICEWNIYLGIAGAIGYTGGVWLNLGLMYKGGFKNDE